MAGCLLRLDLRTGREKIKSDEVKGENDKDVLLEGPQWVGILTRGVTWEKINGGGTGQDDGAGLKIRGERRVQV